IPDNRPPVAEIKNTQINIGTGKDQTIKDLANMIRNVVGFRGLINWDTSKPDGTFRKWLDVTRIKKLGWSEKIPLSEGVKNVYEQYLNS
ncbi:MAG: hypothetical protein CVU05_13590, partial [Bacteroidetes bacterium HGW-Bacteroidetes-21]